MSAPVTFSPASASVSPVRQLLPFTIAVFLGFLAIGVPLPVLPVQVHDGLGYGTIIVGAVIGAQSLTTLLTRPHAGRLCDRYGPKLVSVTGFFAASCAGLLYLASIAPGLGALPSLLVLVAGRMLLGFGESLFITGTAAWSIAVVGADRAGRAFALQGMAMYGAMAAGAPVGGVILHAAGFSGVAAVVVICPLLGGLMAAVLPRANPAHGRRDSFLRVMGTIWMPGTALALASSGFGTIAAFLALRYQLAGWANPGLALTGFGAAYLLMRLLFGGLPDRLGGGAVAMGSLLVEAAGLLLVWSAQTSIMALAGTMLTGFGYSLVFPSLGVEAMRLVAPENRALALGGFLACFDLGLGAAGPVAGLFASTYGLPAAFLAAAGAALLSLVLTARVWAARTA
jgi:MFS family permease